MGLLYNYMNQNIEKRSSKKYGDVEKPDAPGVFFSNTPSREGESRPSSEEGDKCCICYRHVQGDLKVTFYDREGNVYTGDTRQVPNSTPDHVLTSWNRFDVASYSYTGTVVETFNVYCKDWKCEGIEFHDFFQYSSCQDEVDALNSNCNGGDGPGFVSSGREDIMFTYEGWEKLGCCDCPGNTESVTYTSEVSGGEDTPAGFAGGGNVAYHALQNITRDSGTKAGQEYRENNPVPECCPESSEQPEK